jgi:hypothetical protein
LLAVNGSRGLSRASSGGLTSAAARGAINSLMAVVMEDHILNHML